MVLRRPEPVPAQASASAWTSAGPRIIAQHVLGLPRPGYPGARVLAQQNRDGKPARTAG